MHGVDRLLAVVGERAGAGATTIAVNLACALAEEGCTTGLLDLDLAANDAARLCGVRQPCERDGETLLPHQAHGIEIFAPGLELAAHGLDTLRGELLARELADLLERCAWNERHIVVIDLPPGGLSEFEALLATCATVEVLDVGSAALPPDLAIRDAARDGRPFVLSAPRGKASEQVRNAARAILRHSPRS
jgi:ATP-binding protein involved in chromosome partitioning